MIFYKHDEQNTHSKKRFHETIPTLNILTINKPTVQFELPTIFFKFKCEALDRCHNFFHSQACSRDDG